MVSFTPPAALSPGKTLRYLLSGPHSRSGRVLIKKNLFSPNRPPRSQSLYRPSHCRFIYNAPKTSNPVRITKANWWMYCLCIVHATQRYVLWTESRDPECYSGWCIYLPLYSKKGWVTHTGGKCQQLTIGPIVGWTQATLRVSFIFWNVSDKKIQMQGCYRNSIRYEVKQIFRGDLSSVTLPTITVLKMAAANRSETFQPIS